MKSRTAIGTALVGLLLSACSPAGSNQGTPSSAPVPASPPVTTSRPVTTDEQDAPSGESVTTSTTAPTASQPVAADLDPDELTNVLDELDRSLNDLHQSLDDEEGDPLNE